MPKAIQQCQELLRKRVSHPFRLAIPSSRQNPKILWIDDAEVVRDRIAPLAQFCGTFSRKEAEHFPGELPRCGVAFVMRHMLVHHAPQPLDGVQMRTVGRDEVQLDPAARLGQPLLHKLGVMVPGVVQVNMDHRQERIQRFEGFQEPYCRGGIDGFCFDHARLPGFKVNRAVNIDTLTPACLLDCQLFFLGRPAANGPCGMRWMHRIQEQHGLVWAKRVPQLLVTFDEGLLFFRIELAADDFRLVVFQAQPGQQGDQPRTAFVNHAEFPLDKGSDLAR